jgi:hypothetical protein
MYAFVKLHNAGNSFKRFCEFAQVIFVQAGRGYPQNDPHALKCYEEKNHFG